MALSVPLLCLAVVWGYFSVSPELVTSLGVHSLLALVPATFALTLILIGRRLRGHQSLGQVSLKPRLSAALAVGWTLLFVAVAFATDVSTTEPRSVDEDRVWARLQLNPRDPEANLLMAWYERDRDAFADALRRADTARQLGADEPLVLQVESEILAARGDCAGAQATFDRALVSMAERALDAALEENLSLGGFSLPPTLISHCGVSVPGTNAP